MAILGRSRPSARVSDVSTFAFTHLEAQLDAEIAQRLEEAEASGLDPSQRGPPGLT